MGDSGAHKLLAEFQGVPLIRRSAIIASNCKSHSVIVVTGYRHRDIAGSISDLPVTLVHNPAFPSGMASSIAVGVAAAEAYQPSGIMIMLADMPALTGADLDSIISAFRDHEAACIIRAVAGGKSGNPVVFPSTIYHELKSLNGDKGARELIRGSSLPVIDVEIGEGALIDVDTPHAIEAAGGVLRN
ncbi:molybdenum cofactor cytidylyltransferase [Rhizobium paranaense]|uniref:Molybdenum cofactor cytidylyltransferase n=2 Tax=Rhizobium paranaense TaxID=1650438 RepID=A0A7W9D401_9HYPH|nr:molybdenum cofactor cytidylyltransferase [Rhizobium paranaense]